MDPRRAIRCRADASHPPYVGSGRSGVPQKYTLALTLQPYVPAPESESALLQLREEWFGRNNDFGGLHAKALNFSAATHYGGNRRGKTSVSRDG
jgi:hypothetical protein